MLMPLKLNNITQVVKRLTPGIVAEDMSCKKRHPVLQESTVVAFPESIFAISLAAKNSCSEEKRCTPKLFTCAVLHRFRTAQVFHPGHF